MIEPIFNSMSGISLLAIPILTLAGMAAISTIAHHYSLNIKSKPVGNGQHGTAKFATKQEIAKTYTSVPFQVSDWRQGLNLPKMQGLVVGYKHKRNFKQPPYIPPQSQHIGLVDSGDVHCLMIGAAGVGKTAFFLYPNLEFACASGMSFISTDTKGDLFRNYAGIAKDCYGYNISVIDLRNPTRSDGNNLLHLVNKYMDMARNDPNDIASKATAEKYAKIISKTIIGSDEGNYGQNAFFYDAAEGLLTSVILLLSEYLPPEKNEDGKLVDKRHIVSVFKLVQELMQVPAKGGTKGKNCYQLLMEKLPPNHKAKWFSGAALCASDQAMASVLSTVLSKLNTFLDSELEQILCFDTELDAEKFCTEKSAIFLVLPEEDSSATRS